jgi:hypothetical protein
MSRVRLYVKCSLFSSNFNENKKVGLLMNPSESIQYRILLKSVQLFSGYYKLHGEAATKRIFAFFPYVYIKSNKKKFVLVLTYRSFNLILKLHTFTPTIIDKVVVI